MLKLSSILIVTLCLHGIFVTARVAPYYDLNDDLFYSEVRNLLEDQLARKVVGQIDHPEEMRGWGPNITFGQISGVAINTVGNPVIFHRARRIWDSHSFNSTEHFQAKTPIESNVVVVLDRNTGKILDSWGGSMFYLPHGITIDSEGNIWLTDVAMHQVFKFKPKSEKPLLVLGQKMKPGSDNSHFCQPTSVAVTVKGDFYVADGYCNARVMHFNKDGTLKGQYGHKGKENEPSTLNVPHGLALNEALDLLCIADRDNARIICVRAGLAVSSAFGDEVGKLIDPNHVRIFDIKFFGNALMGIAGSKEEGIAVGFTADVQQGGIIDEWQPMRGFHNPHSLAVDDQREAVYVSEIGPNLLWKFSIELLPKLY